MLALFCSLLLAQTSAKVANPSTPLPSAPAVDVTALGTAIGREIGQQLADRIDAQAQANQAILSQLVATVARLEARQVQQAAPAPPQVQTVTRKVFVAKDSSGKSWESASWKDLDGWITRRNATATVKTASVVTAAPTYMELSSYSMPVETYAPPMSYLPMTSMGLAGFQSMGSCAGGACR